MQHGYIRVTFSDDGDGTGKLSATAEARGFAGTGSAWFSTSKIEEFAKAAMAFPLPADQPVLLRGGYWKGGQLEQEHLAVEIYPIDKRGHIGMQVRVATDQQGNASTKSQLTAKLEIITSYQSLVSFSEGLHALVSGRVAEVVLEGEAFHPSLVRQQ